PALTGAGSGTASNCNARSIWSWAMPRLAMPHRLGPQKGTSLQRPRARGADVVENVNNCLRQCRTLARAERPALVTVTNAGLSVRTGGGSGSGWTKRLPERRHSFYLSGRVVGG